MQMASNSREKLVTGIDEPQYIDFRDLMTEGRKCAPSRLSCIPSKQWAAEQDSHYVARLYFIGPDPTTLTNSSSIGGFVATKFVSTRFSQRSGHLGQYAFRLPKSC